MTVCQIVNTSCLPFYAALCDLALDHSNLTHFVGPMGVYKGVGRFRAQVCPLMMPTVYLAIPLTLCFAPPASSQVELHSLLCVSFVALGTTPFIPPVY